MYKITVNEGWCKSCGICADYCPKKVFDFKPEHPVTVARPQDCIGCGMCERRCPDFALEVTKQ